MAITSRINPRSVRSFRTFHALQSQSYRRLWLGNFFSSMGRMMQITLLVWMVLEMTDSPFLVALVGFFGFLPTLLLGVVGGVLADRVDRRRLLIITHVVNLVATLAMTVVLNTDLVRFWQAYLVIFVSGAGWALDFPSRRSIIHDLLGDSSVTNGIALDSVGMHSSRMLGPALAGVLIVLVNVAGGYVAVTLIYLAAVALMWSLNLPHRTVPQQSDGETRPGETPPPEGAVHTADRRVFNGAREMARNLADGFRYVKGQKTILATLMITVLMNLLLFPYQQMVPVIARDILDVGPGLMGVLMSAEGIGALFGAVAIASSGNLKFQGRVYMAGSMLAMTALLLFSFSHWYALSLPLLMVMGLGAAGFGTMQATIMMLVAREEMRGRALGVTSLAIGTMPLGALMIGGVASAVSPTFAIGLNASLGLVLIALVGLLAPSLRQRIVPHEGQQAHAGQLEPRPVSTEGT